MIDHSTLAALADDLRDALDCESLAAGAAAVIRVEVQLRILADDLLRAELHRSIAEAELRHLREVQQTPDSASEPF